MKLAALAAVVCGAVLFSCGPVGKETDCSNGVDDDKNGAADCLDPACAADPACQSFDAGIQEYRCTSQAGCIDAGWAIDRPLRACAAQRCAGQGPEVVALRIDANTDAFFGLQNAQFRAMATRLVKRNALDDSTVTCAAIRAAAPGRTAADADQLEKSGKFNLLGYDVIRVDNKPGGETVTNPLMHTAVGSDFIVYNELWDGYPTPDANSRLPTGRRLGYACNETGAAVQPITTADNCLSDAGTVCRAIQVVTARE